MLAPVFHRYVGTAHVTGRTHSGSVSEGWAAR